MSLNRVVLSETRTKIRGSDASLQMRSALDHCQLRGQLRSLQASIHPGERAFYYAHERSLYCEAERRARSASRDFSARIFDAQNNTSM
jgi:hypothetical protein